MFRVTKLWSHLPYDGQGLLPPEDDDIRALRRWGAAMFRRRLPWYARAAMVGISRLAWAIAATQRCRRFSRRNRLPRREALQLLGDCLAGGALPHEAFIWRGCMGGRHPLPGRSASVVLRYLGNPRAHQVLYDKCAAAEFFAEHGLPSPPVLAVIRRGTEADASAAPWMQAGRYVVKPRHGAGSRKLMYLEVTTSGTVRLNREWTLEEEDLARILTRRSRDDDLLVQREVAAASDLQAMSDRAPVLRISMAREPDSSPFVHSAFFAVHVPDENPANFLRGQIRIPVDMDSGCLTTGLWFQRPTERYTSLPWNGAAIDGRSVPDFAAAVDLALRATSFLPDLPLINWEMIPTADGPVIIEGNTGGDWILTNLAQAAGLESTPLAPLLRRWAIHGRRAE